jgi:hypothetical protein
MPVAPIQEGGRFAVVVPKCPKETYYLLMPVAPIHIGGRFAAVGVSSCLIQGSGRFAAVVSNSLKQTQLIKKSGRFATIIVIFQLPNSSDPLFIDASSTHSIIWPSKRRPLRARSCCYL